MGFQQSFNLQERGELLRRWVSSGENLQNCEHSILAQRTCSQKARRKMKLIAVKDMTLPPYNFSKQLVCTGNICGAIITKELGSTKFCQPSSQGARLNTSSAPARVSKQPVMHVVCYGALQTNVCTLCLPQLCLGPGRPGNPRGNEVLVHIGGDS